MRDLFFLMVLPVMLYAMFKRPFIALGMWPWTALFFPNAWVYGIAGSIRYNLLFAGVCIFGYLMQKRKPKVDFGVLGASILLFFLWTTISTALAIGNQDVAWDYWNRFSKVIALFLFLVLIAEKKLHVDVILWGIVLSVGFYGNLEALKFIMSGGNHMIAGLPGHVLTDRNELALAFVMTLPICAYLMNEYGDRARYLRLGLMCTMGLLVFAVIGTQSRGGFLALLSLGGYLFLKSERKGVMAVMIAILVAALSVVVSTEWTERIDTIENADQDASFMGRVVAWKLSFILAMQNPVFGGGFKALENFAIWKMLSADFFSYPWFYTGDAMPTTTFARAAHSVYFQILGDHGFIALGLYVGALALSWRMCGRAAATVRRHDGARWLSNLATSLQLSIFAFAFGGAALSLAYFDLIFCLFGLVIVLDKRLVPAELARLKQAKLDAQTVAAANPAPTSAPRLPGRVGTPVTLRKRGHG